MVIDVFDHAAFELLSLVRTQRLEPRSRRNRDPRSLEGIDG